jgi:type I restriction enzyme S subunit
MSEWRENKLGDLNCKFLSGYAFKSSDYKIDGIPLVKIGNIQNGIVRTTNSVNCVSSDLINSKTEKFLLKKGDVLIAMTGQGSVGRIGKLYLNDGEMAFLNQRVGKFICDEKNINIGYLYYVLTTPEFQKILFDSASGSGQPNLSPEIILNTKIPYVNFETQTAIAEILSSLDDKIELNNKINQELETLEQTLFKQWFIDFEFPNENGEPYKSSGGEMVDSELGEIPKGWEVGKFENLVKISTGKGINKKDYQEDGEYPVIGANGIMGYYTNYNIEGFRILTGRVGTLGTVRISNEKAWTSDNVLICDPFNKECSHYSYFVMKDFDYNSLNRGSTQPLITQTDLKSQTILLPKKNILTLFQNQMDYFLSMLEINKSEIRNLINLRDTLLPKLISGELEINEINN